MSNNPNLLYLKCYEYDVIGYYNFIKNSNGTITLTAIPGEGYPYIKKTLLQ